MGVKLSKPPLKVTYFLFLCVTFCIPTCFANTDPALDKLEQAIDSEQYSRAWQEAQLLKNKYEGDAYFDFLYGLAALETQHLDHALLALKRAVANEPKQVRPRLELARTYVLLENKPAASSEFKEALELPMPAAVRNNVQLQLHALAQGQAASATSSWSSSVNFAVGHDNNVNLGVNNASISLPIFGEVTLDDSSVKQDSTLAEFGVQLAYSSVQDQQQAWFVNSSINSKQYPHAVAHSSKELVVNAGKAFSDGNKRYQLGLNLQALNLNDQSYSRSQALEANLSYQLAADKTWLSTVNWTNTNYQQTSNKSQDNQSVQLSQQFQLTHKGLGHQLGASISHEMPDNERYEYLSRDVVSLGYGLTKTWNASHSSSLGFNAQHRVNQGKDLTYKLKRKDTRLTLQIAHQVQLSNKTTFFTNAGYVDNASNLELYDSQKAFIKLGINHQF